MYSNFVCDYVVEKQTLKINKSKKKTPFHSYLL